MKYILILLALASCSNEGTTSQKRAADSMDSIAIQLEKLNKTIEANQRIIDSTMNARNRKH